MDHVAIEGLRRDDLTLDVPGRLGRALHQVPAARDLHPALAHEARAVRDRVEHAIHARVLHVFSAGNYGRVTLERIDTGETILFWDTRPRDTGKLARALRAAQVLDVVADGPTRAATEEWLARHGAPAGTVLLRRDGDRRPARITKVAILRRLARERPVAVLVDDDPAVCRAAREAGFAVMEADWSRPDQTLFEAQERLGET